MKRLALAALAWACLGGPALAEADLFSPETLAGRLDLRLGASDGERSWVDGGFGKTRFSGAKDGWAVRPQVAEAALEWKPRFNWEWQGVVSAEMQPRQSPKVDLGEAYIQYKPVPHSDTHFSARAGLMYPAISLEHDAPIWSVSRTITPSAINAWVGEEVKVVGLEATVLQPIAGQDFQATLGVFDHNDTSATLLTFRGWSLSDVKGTPFSAFKLPPLSSFMSVRQDDETYPIRKLDKRLGYYGRLVWRPSGRFTFEAFHYDNLGNKTAVDDELQWSWATRFTNLGATVMIDDRTRILSQVMWGQTLMGYTKPGTGIWVDLDFKSAYILATRSYGKAAITGRLDYFQTHDNAAAAYGRNGEEGWSMTGAYRYTLNPHVEVVLEAVHVESDRPARRRVYLAAEQAQTTLQSSLRLTF